MDNKNKLTRIFQPSMRLYFILLVVFAAVTMFFDRALACAEVGVIILLYIYSRFSNNRRRSQIVEYIEDMADSVNSATKDTLVNFPLPMVIFNLEDGKLVWSNDEFLFMTGDREHFFEMHLKDFLGEFNYKWIVEGKKWLRICWNCMSGNTVCTAIWYAKKNESQREFFGVLYFADVTEYENIRREYGDSRPIVSTLMLDNYDELFKSLTDTSKSQLMSVIDDKIGVWSQDCNGILFKYDRDKYIFIFEERYLPEFVNEKFSVLDTVHDIVNPSGIHATVSIGVGKDGDTLAESFRFAELATDMALSRGGDQAVIKNKFNFEFYGGHSKTLEKGTKVKSRVMANAFGELISDASQIFVMGHKYADLDTVGAAVGISCISRKRMKKCYIVIDMDNNASKELVDRITTLPEYEDTFISSQDAMLRADGKSLLVVVDTNRPDQVESKELLMSCNKVVVIDHHRRASDYISDAALISMSHMLRLQASLSVRCFSIWSSSLIF